MKRIIFVIQDNYVTMNRNVKIGLIVTGVVATLGVGLWIYTSQKKKKNPNWKLLADVKKNRKVVITRND